MSSDVTRFPKTTWDRIRNRRGQKSVNCIVTGRYLAFSNADAVAIEAGHPVWLNVMTDTGPGRDDRKLCELAVTLEELESVVELLRKELTDRTPE